MSILITGGAGFIGSHLAELLINRSERVVVVDRLTYAGSLKNLEGCLGHPGFSFYRGSVCNLELLEHIMGEADVRSIVHLAAETHVDRSISESGRFLQTNVLGLHTVLEATRSRSIERLILVSTDEVYGECMEGRRRETDSLRPRNPYSASKAAQEHLAYSYWVTHGVPVVIVRGCNNYGPRQHPEKFIPRVISCALGGLPVPIYGDGSQVREWIYVRDFVRAIVTLMDKGECGETYNVGSGRERENLEVARMILGVLGISEDLITHVPDRPGHDRRYAIDSSRVRALGWSPEVSFESGLRQTIRWFMDNRGHLQRETRDDCRHTTKEAKARAQLR